MIALEKSN